jgi:hypothetical protein
MRVVVERIKSGRASNLVVHLFVDRCTVGTSTESRITLGCFIETGSPISMKRSNMSMEFMTLDGNTVLLEDGKEHLYTVFG